MPLKIPEARRELCQALSPQRTVEMRPQAPRVPNGWQAERRRTVRVHVEAALLQRTLCVACCMDALAQAWTSHPGFSARF